MTSLTPRPTGRFVTRVAMKENPHDCKHDVPVMNEGLTGLERHEGEYLMTEFSFWGELTLL